MAMPHEVLGVPQDADEATINAAFRKAAKKYHPDLNGGDAAGIRHLRHLIAARERLARERKRRPGTQIVGDGVTAMRGTVDRKATLFAGAVTGALGLLAVPVLLAHWAGAQPETVAVELTTTVADAGIPDAGSAELKAIRDIQEASSFAPAETDVELAPEPRLQRTARRRRFAQPANRFKNAVTQAAFLMSKTFRRLASQ
ncbi:MAG: J domain-containing protein [Rhodomicrobium sp.]